MSTSINIGIGVEDYCIELNRPCSKSNKKIELSLTFFLTGNFLPAAYSDNLIHTVDYDLLCRVVLETLRSRDCSTFNQAVVDTRSAIMKFSPLITGGYFTLIMRCHETYRENRHLL